MEPQFRASGLASGIDTQGLVEKLMQIEGRPLTVIAQRQTAFGVQLSTIASLISKMKSLGSAADTLGTSGVSVNTASGTHADFSVSGNAATEGNYTMRVNRLAQEAKARTAVGVSSISDEALIPDGALEFQLDVGSAAAVTYTFDTTAKSLSSLVSEINANAPKLVASTVYDGTNYFLAVSRRETGHEGTDVDATNGLVISQVPAVGFMTVTQAAANARVYVDGLALYRKSNTISDAIAGATITLKAASDVSTNLTFARDNSASAANVQKFVDGYNAVTNVIRDQLRADPKKPSEQRVKGSLLQTLQRQLQNQLSQIVNPTGSVRTTADIGIKQQTDGTLLFDRVVFDAKMASNPTGVNSLFQTASTGVGDAFDTLSDTYTNAVDGLLLSQKNAVEKAVDLLDERAVKVQRHIDATRERLFAQFNAMERMYQNFISIGSFLENQTYGFGSSKK